MAQRSSDFCAFGLIFTFGHTRGEGCVGTQCNFLEGDLEDSVRTALRIHAPDRLGNLEWGSCQVGAQPLWLMFYMVRVTLAMILHIFGLRTMVLHRTCYVCFCDFAG